MTFVGGVFSLRSGRGRRGRHVVRLVALRGPPVPADPPVGRGRLTRATRSRSARSPTTRCARAAATRRPRLEDMDVNWVEASLCVPDVPALLRPDVHSRRKDRELARPLREGVQRLDGRRVVRAAPDGRLIPLIIIPLWDAELAAAEVRRNAARGVHAVCFSRDPAVPRPAVDPHRTATGTRSSRRARRPSTVVCMHIGSSSKMPSTSADAPAGGRLDAHLHERGDVARRLAVLRRARALPEARSSRTPRARSAGSRTCSSAPTRCGRSNRGWGGVADKVQRAAVELLLRARLRLLLRRPARPAVARRRRRRQHHLRDRLPAHRLDVAAHEEGREEIMQDLADDEVTKIVRGNAIRMLRLPDRGLVPPRRPLDVRRLGEGPARVSPRRRWSSRRRCCASWGGSAPTGSSGHRPGATGCRARGG